MRGEDLQVGLDGGEDVALEEGQDDEQEDWLPQLLEAHLGAGGGGQEGVKKNKTVKKYKKKRAKKR